MTAPGFLFVTVDCVDPNRVAAFWSDLLGTPIDDEMDDGRFVFLAGRDGLPVLCFQRVPEPKAAKNRVHLDFQVEDLEATTARIEALGGSWPGTEHSLDGFRWRTVQDPEGNEFDVTVVAG